MGESKEEYQFNILSPSPQDRVEVIRKKPLKISLDPISAPGRALAWLGARQSQQPWCVGGPRGSWASLCPGAGRQD